MKQAIIAENQEHNKYSLVHYGTIENTYGQSIGDARLGFGKFFLFGNEACDLELNAQL
jgi:hypothetical protein